MRCPARCAFLLEHPLRRRLLRLDRLARSLPLGPSSRVLDLGAGSGVVAGALLDRFAVERLVLLDAQWGMLRRARHRLEGNIEFVVAVAEALPFIDDGFDIVLLVTVLGEVDDADRALREVRRVLRPGGVVSITEHLPDPDFRSLDRIRPLMESHGFLEVRVLGSRWSFMANFTTA